MAKKSISQKRAEKQQMENAALRQVFNVFLAGLAAECWMLLAYRNYVMSTVDAMLTWHTVLKVSMYVGLVLLAVGVGVGIWKKDCPKCRKVMPLVGVAGLFLAFSGWVSTTFYPRGVTVMCIFVPIITLLGLVFFLYQHECFLSTVVLAGALFASWVCSNGLAGSWKIPVIIGAVCSVIAVAAIAYLTHKAQQRKGKLKGLQMFSHDCDYRVLYAVFAIASVTIIISMVAPGIVYYLMWVLGISLFAELVYYTTKLM